MATTAKPVRSARVACGLALVVALTLATRLPFWGHPAADYDEQLYSLIARHWLAGELPYVNLWDRKPLGLFAIYAAAHALLGPGVIAYQSAALLASLAGGWLTFRLAARFAPPATAAFAAALYPPLMAIYGSHSGQSEIFLTPLVTAMALLALHARASAETRTALHRHLAAMALGGLALQVKYSALPACLWFGTLALHDLHRRHLPLPRLAASAAAFAALGLAPTLAAAALYAAHGQFDAWLFANFTSIRHRAALPLAITLPRQLTDLAPLAALAAGGLIQRRLGPRREWRPVTGWLLAGVAGLFLSTTVYTYYYAALVPAVIVIALPLFATRTGPLLLAGLLAWLTATFNPLTKAADARAEQATLAAMARAIPAGCLYIHDGPLALHALTGTTPLTRFAYPDHLNNALEARALPVDPAAEVARIMALQPTAVITSAQPVTLPNHASGAVLARALAAGYRHAGAWPFQQRQLDLFTRIMPKTGCANSISKSSNLRPYDVAMVATGIPRRTSGNGIGLP
ncbi:MAG: hypothetical protein KGN34_06905 [Sphingomonadales bacterium]|nr:hypothetical protein [Sphingomonadales bacterium]